MEGGVAGLEVFFHFFGFFKNFFLFNFFFPFSFPSSLAVQEAMHLFPLLCHFREEHFCKLLKTLSGEIKFNEEAYFQVL